VSFVLLLLGLNNYVSQEYFHFHTIHKPNSDVSCIICRLANSAKVEVGVGSKKSGINLGSVKSEQGERSNRQTNIWYVQDGDGRKILVCNRRGTGTDTPVNFLLDRDSGIGQNFAVMSAMLLASCTTTKINFTDISESEASALRLTLARLLGLERCRLERYMGHKVHVDTHVTGDREPTGILILAVAFFEGDLGSPGY
jgi:hypothetical protein